MYKLKSIGNFAAMPAEAIPIYEGNVQAVQNLLAEGWEVNSEITLSKHSRVTPLELALIRDDLEMVKLLVEHGAELNNSEKPAFLTAARYGSEKTVRYIHSQGAEMNRMNRVKSNAFQEAYYGGGRNIPLLLELGLDIRRYGGETLRSAVSDHKLKLVQYLLDQGVDVNYNEADMVYPYRATPLTVAARNNNLPMVQYLIERGADVTIAEQDGERAYTIAVAAKNMQMAELIKAQEPADFHDLNNKLHALRAYKLPAALVSFLKGKELRLNLPGNEYEVGYIDFFTLTDTIEMKAGRSKLLRLSAVVDNYSDLLIVWHPGSQKIGCYDVEHQEYHPLAKFKDFIADPVTYLGMLLEG
ncbi:hypothetical protein C2I18_24965 [Paenibacillus sp. PK3_47]|uniref:ankyrin repeat domain-containing protein n=1 Tax=Paenibacillus sp. PK3_47 TaxID=2072642 RepID=UPI00201DB498|nr:ankyrin repeat domain-containing protein [Paenibacillus sp. PK3_47]UQZ36497.1 hypothetical protein C2I18_24965 [Paenibacillus sp. PK3_47]